MSRFLNYKDSGFNHDILETTHPVEVAVIEASES
jgi:hypothetical protein